MAVWEGDSGKCNNIDDLRLRCGQYLLTVSTILSTSSSMVTRVTLKKLKSGKSSCKQLGKQHSK